MQKAGRERARHSVPQRPGDEAKNCQGPSSTASLPPISVNMLGNGPSSGCWEPACGKPLAAAQKAHGASAMRIQQGLGPSERGPARGTLICFLPPHPSPSIGPRQRLLARHRRCRTRRASCPRAPSSTAPLPRHHRQSLVRRLLGTMRSRGPAQLARQRPDGRTSGPPRARCQEAGRAHAVAGAASAAALSCGRVSMGAHM